VQDGVAAESNKGGLSGKAFVILPPVVPTVFSLLQVFQLKLCMHLFLYATYMPISSLTI
jgi:hypothetical protein